MTVTALLRRSRPQPLAGPLQARLREAGRPHVSNPERLAPPVARPAAPTVPFADGSCDSVVVGHDLLGRTDAADVLVEWRRVLRPGGTLAVMVRAGGELAPRPGHDLGPGPSSGAGATAAALEGLVQRIGGFVDISTDVVGPERSHRLRATKSPVPQSAAQG